VPTQFFSLFFWTTDRVSHHYTNSAPFHYTNCIKVSLQEPFCGTYAIGKAQQVAHDESYTFTDVNLPTFFVTNYLDGNN
jgi:hypothetical protein